MVKVTGMGVIRMGKSGNEDGGDEGLMGMMGLRMGMLSCAVVEFHVYSNLLFLLLIGNE